MGGESSETDKLLTETENQTERPQETEVALAGQIRTEEELRESEARYRLLFESSPDPMVLYDTNGAVVSVNHAFVETYGWSREEWVGKRIEFVPPEELAKTRQAIDRSLAGENVEFESRRLTKDGRTLAVLVKTTNFKDAHGNLVGTYVIHQDLTDKKATQAALLENERRYRQLLDSSPDAISVYDAQGRITYLNPAFAQTFGWTLEELAGKGIDFVPPHEMERTREAVQRTLEGETVLLESQRLTKDGRLLDIQLKTAIFTDPQGRLAGDIVIYRDITEQKKVEAELRRHREHLGELVQERTAELIQANLQLQQEAEERQRVDDALRESENKYRLLADNMNDVLWLLDINRLIFTYISPSVERQRGYTPEEAMGYSLQETLTPESLELAVATVAEELTMDETNGVDPQRTITMELENLCRDGSTIWTEATCSILRDEAGAPVSVIGVSRDITERRLAREQIRKSEERYRMILEASPDAMVLYDIEGHVLYINPAFRRAFGWTMEELFGRRIDYVPEEEWPRTREMLELIKKGEGFGGFETRRFTKTGEILDVSMSWSVWRDHEGAPAGSLVTVRDVTEHKKILAQLEQSRKMEAIGTLAGGIAHDFNNILQAISGNVQLILMKLDLDDDSRNSLSGIDNHIHRAVGMVQHLLTLSRKRIVRLEPVILNQEISQVCRLLERIIPKMIALEQNLAPDLLPVGPDPGQLEQIILNLAGNAIDAMPDGGRLFFETENVQLDEHFCRTHAELQPGPYVLLKVADTGSGMDQQTVSHIFEPFFTTKPVGSGTGLGLSTAYGIVKNHQGLITCYSDLGRGTVFNIYLPVLTDVPPGELVEPQEFQAKSWVGRETVLVVDDEEAILRVGRELLGMNGFKVLSAGSGEEAVSLYEKQGAEIDLVILDLGMPGMGGRRCLETLIGMNPEVRVIVSSGYATGTLLKELESLGASGFIGKPYRLNDMLEKVREVLDGNGR